MKEPTITVSARFFEHLLACLANQKFIHDVNADGLDDGIDEVMREQRKNQQTIDRAYRKGWELLMQQLPPEHKEDDPFALDTKLLGQERGGPMISKWRPRAKSVKAWVIRLFYLVYPHLHWHTFTDLYVAVDTFHFKYCERCRSLHSRCPSCGRISLRYTNVVVNDGTKEEKKNERQDND